MKLSVCLATFNEEENIGRTLEAIKEITDEIIIVDGGSVDKTLEIAQKYGAHITKTTNPPIFHINKQKALDQAKGEWVLLLDSDEVVSPALRKEIQNVMEMDSDAVEHYQTNLKNRSLFLRNQVIINKQSGQIGKIEGEYAAFFIPRLNFFLGKYLRYGGVYPDGVIRLFKKGKAYLPCKDVHEQLVVDGKVGWLQNDLYHYDSPTFKRYLMRNSRYINLIVQEFSSSKLPKNGKNFVQYMFIKPISWFFMTQIRHKGVLDGFQGVVFSFFSALRFPRAYWRYLGL